jgi:hypothetical protein
MFRIIKSYFIKRNERRWHEWNHALGQTISGLALGKVVRIRQKARFGTKAYVRWHTPYNPKSRKKYAIWVPKHWPRKGDYVLGRGSYGHGDHHNERVYFFNEEIEIIDPAIYRGYLRHEKRINKNQAKIDK